MNQRRSSVATLLILIALLFAAIARSEGAGAGDRKSELPETMSGQTASLSAPPQAGVTDPAELEAFLDTLLPQEMEEYHIAGAAVAVVKDGKLMFARGYGFADLEKRIPVDPEQTIFRIGSVGKVFTWTAVMQLVEQGKLDLDADINSYLDFRIPDTYPEPITLKHLLTHTSGFEDRWFGSVVAEPGDMVPEREWLASNIWARVQPPGYAGYSNFNAMLAGYIVARVSGQPYEQYIQEHVLSPLGMVHATVRSPIPAELRPYVSVGYTYADGAFQPFPEYFPQPAGLPSGFHLASVTDVARFMMAHLQGGAYSDGNSGERRILQESTAQQMHSTLYTPDRRLGGTAYGFFDWSDNGQRTLGHTGYGPPMHSVLLLLPDEKLGVFVAYNSDGGGNLTGQHSGFQRAFFDHYYPTPAMAPAQPAAGVTERAGRFAGSYSTMNVYTTLVKLGGLFGGGYPVEIDDAGDGTLLFSLEGMQGRFVEVEPLYFRQVDGPYALVFREDDRGRITHLFTDLMPQYAAVKLAWYETGAFQRALVAGCVLLFLSTLFVAAVRVLRNRRRGNRRPAPGGARIASWIILGISILNLLLLAGVALSMPQIMQNILLPPPAMVALALGFGVLSAVMTVPALVYALLAWKNRYWGIAGRAYYTLVTVAAVAFVWFMDYWNLLGWRY